jgi:CheY-like chemotaxis protein
MTGWDLLHAMRLDGPNATTPAIVLSVVADQAAGSAFAIRDYLTKPAEPADLLAALKRAGVTAPAYRKVVVLDGDDDARARIAEVLRRAGYEVFGTHDRGEALRQIERYAPDALVLDLLIDDGNSMSFLAELRSLECGQQLPVFVCTEMQLSRDDTLQLRQVARAIMRKDSDAAHQLLSELRIALGQARLSASVQE